VAGGVETIADDELFPIDDSELVVAAGSATGVAPGAAVFLNSVNV
jgi:hypothetical protein